MRVLKHFVPYQPTPNKTLSRRLGAWLILPLALALGACAAPQPPAATGPVAVETTPLRSEPSTPPVAAGAATPVATQPVASQPVAAPPTPSAPTPRSKPAPPMSQPLPPQQMPDAIPVPAGAAARLDTSCRTAADCAVKNVGSCCGVQPSCVNVNAKVDPKAVQAQCARSGMMSTCGFKPVESCQCVQGQCKDQPMMVEGQ